jgi:hypothetical protein
MDLGIVRSLNYLKAMMGLLTSPPPLPEYPYQNPPQPQFIVFLFLGSQGRTSTWPWGHLSHLHCSPQALHISSVKAKGKTMPIADQFPHTSPHPSY